VDASAKEDCVFNQAFSLLCFGAIKGVLSGVALRLLAAGRVHVVHGRWDLAGGTFLPAQNASFVDAHIFFCVYWGSDVPTIGAVRPPADGAPEGRGVHTREVWGGFLTVTLCPN